jgi:N-acyl-D-amino-acid deacylase
MRSLIVALSLYAVPGIALAGNPPAPPSDANTAIDRGLAFLAKDALAWREKYQCASCHHAGLVIWSMREAKQRGHAVDESVLADLTKWVAESGDGKTGVPRPPDIPKAFNEKAVYFALALGANPEPDDVSRKGLDLLLSTLKSDQVESGAWLSWPDTRPPIFGNSDERATALATLALLPGAASGDENAKIARDKGVQWLIEDQIDDDSQTMALRLVLWQRLGRPTQELEPLASRIQARQNEDGGWSQTNDMPSDAWATGQALYALAHAGFKSNNPALQRGYAFLVNTQREDGSWPMTSRPTKPGGEGGKNLVPITGAGAAWAVMGLVRSY